MKKLLIIILVICMSLCSIGLTACGDNKKEEPATQGLIYSLIDENAYSISGYSGSSHEVVIPSKYNGKVVTKIDDIAFAQNNIVKSIKIGGNVTSIGEGAFFYCESLTSIVIPNSVTNIGEGAFAYCTSLQSIVIPNNITSIGERAFYACENLQYNIKNNIKYLGNSQNKYIFLVGPVSNNITYAQIDNNCKIIDAGAFLGCNLLETVSMGNNVKIIQSGAFEYCTALENIEIPNSLKEVGEAIFYGCNNLRYNEKDGVAYLGNAENNYLYLLDAISDNFDTLTIDRSCRFMNYQAFNYYDNIEKVNYLGTIDEWVQIDFASRTANPTCIAGDLYINNELVTEVVLTAATKISKNAFVDCKSIRSVTMADSVENIGEYAFSDCDSLTSVTIGNSVSNIGEWAFSDCESLTNVTIGNSVSNIGEWAFAACASLENIVISNSVVSIGEYAFYECFKLTYNIKEGLKYLGNSSNLYLYLADTESTDITSATIDNGCKFIGESAFAYCKSLTSILIPNSITSIGNNAFCGCYLLESITIPNSVKSIDYLAFEGCSSLTIYCEATEKPNGWSSEWNVKDLGDDCEYVPVVWGYVAEN